MAYFKSPGRATAEGRSSKASRRMRMSALPRRQVRGPVPRARMCPATGKAQALRLMKVAGAYWRGAHHRNEMLQRLRQRPDDKRRPEKYHDARRGREKRPPQAGPRTRSLHIDEHAPGVVFWHPRGWTVWQEVEQYMRRVPRQRLPGGQGSADPRQDAVGRRLPLGTSTARTCSRRNRRSATTRSSR